LNLSCDSRSPTPRHLKHRLHVPWVWNGTCSSSNATKGKTLKTQRDELFDKERPFCHKRVLSKRTVIHSLLAIPLTKGSARCAALGLG
jgi:hypothetical protein